MPVDSGQMGWNPADVVPSRRQQAQQNLNALIAENGCTHKMIDRMQNRQELDVSIIKTTVPQGMPQES